MAKIPVRSPEMTLTAALVADPLDRVPPWLTRKRYAFTRPGLRTVQSRSRCHPSTDQAVPPWRSPVGPSTRRARGKRAASPAERCFRDQGCQVLPWHQGAPVSRRNPTTRAIRTDSGDGGRSLKIIGHDCAEPLTVRCLPKRPAMRQQFRRRLILPNKNGTRPPKLGCSNQYSITRSKCRSRFAPRRRIWDRRADAVHGHVAVDLDISDQ